MARFATYFLPFIAMLSSMPRGTAAVDLLQYFASYSCQGPNYHGCWNIAANTCCVFTQQPAVYRGFACAWCPEWSAHMIWRRDNTQDCAVLVGSKLGIHPNCLNLGSTFRAYDGHSWCNLCRVGSQGRMVDATTGEEQKCTKSVSPNILVMGDRTFNVTAMPHDLHAELIRLATEGGEVPSEFDAFEQEHHVLRL